MTDADILWLIIEDDLSNDPEWVAGIEWIEADWQWREAYEQWREDTYDPDS